MEGGNAPPPNEGELPQDLCPSCGKPLKRVEGHAESYCEAEKLFVEIVKKPELDAARPPLVRAEVLAATKRRLKELALAYGLRTSGSKTETLTRVLRYMDEHGIDLPPEEAEEAAMETPTAEPAAQEPGAEPSRDAARKEEPAPLASVDQLLAEIEEAARVKPPAEQETRPSAPGIRVEGPTPEGPAVTEPALEPEKAAGERVDAEPAAGPVGEAPAEKVEEPELAAEPAGAPAGEASEAEIAGEAEAEAEIVEEVALEAEVPATTTEPFEEAVAEAPEAEALAEAVAETAPVFSAARLRRDRRRFYVGIVLVALGGSGLVLGSFLHDFLRVPWVGQTYEAFGPLNLLAAGIGGVLLLGGLLAIGLGLRGGILRGARASEA